MSRQGKIGLTPATGFDIKTISFGAVAQLGERFVRNEEVVSSILISSTGLQIEVFIDLENVLTETCS